MQIAHGQYIVIGGNTIIGDNLVIYNGLTLGVRGNFILVDGIPQQEALYSIIDDGFIIYSGAKIYGKVHLHKNVIVMENAIVFDYVNPNCMVGGHPARIIKKHEFQFNTK